MCLAGGSLGGSFEWPPSSGPSSSLVRPSRSPWLLPHPPSDARYPKPDARPIPPGISAGWADAIGPRYATRIACSHAGAGSRTVRPGTSAGRDSVGLAGPPRRVGPRSSLRCRQRVVAIRRGGNQRNGAPFEGSTPGDASDAAMWRARGRAGCPRQRSGRRACISNKPFVAASLTGAVMLLACSGPITPVPALRRRAAHDRHVSATDKDTRRVHTHATRVRTGGP